jgi:hypothetical protein
MSSAIKNSIRLPGMNDKVCPSCRAGDERSHCTHDHQKSVRAPA